MKLILSILFIFIIAYVAITIIPIYSNYYGLVDHIEQTLKVNPDKDIPFYKNEISVIISREGYKVEKPINSDKHIKFERRGDKIVVYLNYSITADFLGLYQHIFKFSKAINQGQTSM